MRKTMSAASASAGRRGPLVLVTGATDGIGAETARELARRGARVIVHGRNAEKARRVSEEIKTAEAPVVADLTSLAQVRAMAANIAARGEALDVLLHNAGVFMKERVLTGDSHETTMAVALFAPLLLSHLLLEPLRRAKQGRIVFVSSVAHQRGGSFLRLDDLSMERSWQPYGSYAASKLAQVLVSMELSRRLRGTTVTVNSLHPGVVSTRLLRDGFEMEGPDSLKDGAATSVFLALDPSVADVSGEYFVRSAVARHAGTAGMARDLYEKSCTILGIDALPLVK